MRLTRCYVSQQLAEAVKVLSHDAEIIEWFRVFRTKDNLERFNRCLTLQLQECRSCQENCEMCKVIHCLHSHSLQCPVFDLQQYTVCSECRKCRFLDRIHHLMSHTNGYICAIKKCPWRNSCASLKCGPLTEKISTSRNTFQQTSGTLKNLDRSPEPGHVYYGTGVDLVKLMGVSINYNSGTQNVWKNQRKEQKNNKRILLT